MHSLQIRSASHDDVSALVQLNAVVQSLHATLYPDLFLSPSEATARAYFEEVVAGAGNRVRIAKLGDVDVGYVVWRYERRPPSAFRRGFGAVYLEQIAVDLTCRRAGVGMALVHDVSSAAAALGAQTIVIDTWEGNVDARLFFEAQGFSTRRVIMWRNVE
jgi:ribosomal protein S18 acetylase RimI-like enzyme